MRNANGPARKVKNETNGGSSERVFSTKDVAAALGVSKMTVLRHVSDGRLPQPGLFLQQQGVRVWLWNASELAQALALFRQGTSTATVNSKHGV